MGRTDRKIKEVQAQIEHNRYMLDTMLDRKAEWGDWKEYFTILPRRCELTKEWIIGYVCRRTRVEFHIWADPKTRYEEHQYASMKEVFIRKLKNGNTERDN